MMRGYVPPRTMEKSPLISPPAPSVIDWGRTAYEDARRRQEALVEQRMNGLIEDNLIFTEHEPVFTLGLRKGADRHLIWNATQLSEAGIGLSATNRGGDITYHGPGQIVGYPIVSLASRKDLHAYLRFLEDVLIDAVGDFGLIASRREGKTGIWIGSRKIAAIGVAVRRWIAYHGFALNVSPDLSHYHGIVPCGIASDEGTVTSMELELGQPPRMESVKASLAERFAQRWTAFVNPIKFGSG